MDVELRRCLNNVNVSVWKRVQLLLKECDNGTDNGAVSGTDSPVDRCADEIPTSAELFRDMPATGYVIVGFLVLTVCLTLANYAEEIHFILKNFRKETRRRKTIWILAFYPTFSITGLLGCLVPRSGTIADVTANVFFGTCLYNFGRLMIDYMGGPQRMWELIEDREMSLNTPPCCCCCVCLPKIKFNRQAFLRLTVQVMQLSIVRPILMFVAAVLWTNGSYQPGNMSLDNAYVYVTVLNLISTLVAVYGLMLTRGVLRPELERQFSITGKIASLQLTLLCSAVPNLVISILVSTGVIQCSALLPSKARSEMLYHAFLVFMMFPFSLMGRSFYRRPQDGQGFANAQPGSKFSEEELPAVVTDQPQTTQTSDETKRSDDVNDSPMTSFSPSKSQSPTLGQIQ